MHGQPHIRFTNIFIGSILDVYYIRHNYMFRPLMLATQKTPFPALQNNTPHMLYSYSISPCTTWRRPTLVGETCSCADAVDSQYTTNKYSCVFDFGDVSFSNVLVNDAVNCCDYVKSVTDESVRSTGGMTLTAARRNQRTRRKSVPVPLCPPDNPHKLVQHYHLSLSRRIVLRCGRRAGRVTSSCALAVSRQMNHNFNMQECLARVVLH